MTTVTDSWVQAVEALIEGGRTSALKILTRPPPLHLVRQFVRRNKKYVLWFKASGKAHNSVPRFGGELVSDAFNSSPAAVGLLLGTGTASRSRIIMPTFQRGYMWKKKHVEAFWDDVDKQREQNKQMGEDAHYLWPHCYVGESARGKNIPS